MPCWQDASSEVFRKQRTNALEIIDVRWCVTTRRPGKHNTTKIFGDWAEPVWRVVKDHCFTCEIVQTAARKALGEVESGKKGWKEILQKAPPWQEDGWTCLQARPRNVCCRSALLVGPVSRVCFVPAGATKVGQLSTKVFFV